MSTDKMYVSFEGNSPAEITKYIIKQCGGKTGVYKYLYHDKADNVMKLQTVMSEYKMGGNGKKKMYIHQFKPEVVLKNGAEVVPTNSLQEVKNPTQTGGMFPMPINVPIAPVRYYPSGPVYAPRGVSPFHYLYSLVSFKDKVKKMTVDGIECEKCVSDLESDENKKIVRDKVEEIFTNRYNDEETDVTFDKLTDLEFDNTNKKYKITIHYVKKSYSKMVYETMRSPFSRLKRKRMSPAERIEEIRDMVNEGLKKKT